MLIDKYLPLYSEHEMVLDQGSEGACTGFGLAAMINYLLWRQRFIDLTDGDRLSLGPRVKLSPRMLYQMARIYDEWPGEDYEGSSCRGAMKGWHHHGICTEEHWPYRNARGEAAFVEPGEGWEQDAAQRPLGAYYRINKGSIGDLQAALCEVGAIFASSHVQGGWFLDSAGSLEDAVIDAPMAEPTGGHAFALVGYTPEGFIVQNSWGGEWGFHGFGVVSYADWVEHGMDAWVAVLGAPMVGARSKRTYSTASLRQTAVDERMAPRPVGGEQRAPHHYKDEAVRPLSEEAAYEQALVVGNNGSPISRLVAARDAEAAVEWLCYARPLQWLRDSGHRKLVIYAHGGLNTESASINRIRVMAPYFLANGAYPLFFTWRTGFLESLRFIFGDRTWGDEPRPLEPARASLWTAIRERAAEARDRAAEVTSARFIKPIWTQMKQNAEAAARPNGGLHALADRLRRLEKDLDGLEVHLIGHSAGAIALGRLLELMARRKMSTETCTLWAPACTVAFANRYYRRAIERGVLPKNSGLWIEMLSNERELGDSVGGIYGKSLLYLVSRALEVAHKTPLLGLELAWQPPSREEDRWSPSGPRQVADWLKFWGDTERPRISRAADVSAGPMQIPNSHGAFDNSVGALERALRTVFDGQSLEHDVENLTGY